MPLDTQTVANTKERIISYIQLKGPSLPVHIARQIDSSPLFTSAFLSELYREQKLLMSHLKVGSSSLYLISGQEQQLENFVQYLNQKEREAYNLLKENKVLMDEQLQPAIRVAIREIKDFALPFRATIETEQKIFWRYAFTPETEVEEILKKRFSKHSSEQKQIASQEKSKEEITPSENSSKEQIKEAVQSEERDQTIHKRSIKKKKPADSKFLSNLKEYLTAKDIEILSIIEEKAKELSAKIRINDSFGKQEYYLIAKERKKVKEEDLALVLHKAQQEKMLALFMAPGELDKKAHEFIKEYRNLVKFDRVKF